MNQCFECKKNLVGRSDKKFCDDGCRNTYNNRRNSEVNKIVTSINSVLKRNRNILQNLLPENGKISVSEKTLKVLGFNFEYYTSEYETKKGTCYKFCYEYGYLKIDSNVYMLVRRQNAMSASAS